MSRGIRRRGSWAAPGGPRCGGEFGGGVDCGRAVVAERKAVLRASRIDTTRALVEALAK